MIVNLNMSIHLNILVLLSLLIYHGLLTSSLSTLKLVKPLGSSTGASINMLSSNTFKFILLSFRSLFYLWLLCSWPTTFFYKLWNSQQQEQFVLKMCYHKWENDYSSLLSTLNLLILSTHHSLSKCLFHKITNNLPYFPSDVLTTNLLQVMLLITLTISP